jgi:hypothetical protein
MSGKNFVLQITHGMPYHWAIITPHNLINLFLTGKFNFILYHNSIQIKYYEVVPKSFENIFINKI